METNMIVQGPTIYLRTILESDLDFLFARINDIELRGPYFPVWIQSQAGFRRRFQEDGFWSEGSGTLVICANDDSRILGQIMRFRATPYWDSYELGYRLLDRSLEGRGVTTEALMLFSYALFTSDPVHRLELQIVPDNLASRRVAEKCGYRYESTARQVLHRGNAHLDMMTYALLRPDAPATLAEAIARLAAPPPQS
jgi:RimJ/RimL family protein N-acetyltransferase